MSSNDWTESGKNAEMCNAQSAICTIILTQRYDFFSGARVFCLYQYNLCNGHFSKDKGQSKYATLQIFLIKRLQF